MAKVFISISSNETDFVFMYTWHEKFTQTPANQKSPLSWKVAEGFDVMVTLLSRMWEQLGSNLDIG
jgi:hypothetical protein